MSEVLKVVIADDEMIIREGIRESIDWESLGMEVVAEAEDGEEALEAAIMHQADLLLVDLNMPIMNGIQLMGELRERQLPCRIVIVTGHDEFQYAQKAIRFGVEDYILKPIDPDLLMAALRKIREQIELEKVREKHLALASHQIRKNIPMLRERFCNEWIEAAASWEEIEQQLQFLELPATLPQLFGIIRWPESDLRQSPRTERERQLMIFAMENIVEEHLSDVQHILFRDSLGCICMMLWGNPSPDLFNKMEEAILSCLKLQVAVHAEPILEGENIPEVYRRARSRVYKETVVSPVIRRSRQYLREHYHESSLSLENTAEAIGVSSVYLSRLFRQEMDVSFIAYLTQLRISQAIRLLTTTDLTIAEIAEAIGYESQHYFSTAFKKSVGVSPIKYRKGEVG